MRRCAWICMAAMLAAGCDGDGGAAAESERHATTSGAVYAMMVQVYDTDDRTVYVVLSDTLDIEQLSLEDAREFGGVANLAAIGGDLFVSDGLRPRITRYEITDELEWRGAESISFASYPLADNANFYYQFILDEHTAYLPFETTKRILWDPAALEIREVMDDSALVLETSGLKLEAGGNRNGVRYEDAVLQAFFYRDEDWFEFGSKSAIAVYDPETHEETHVIEAPCAGLSIATRDEQGNTYFSPWDMAVLSLYDRAPAPCIVRVGPDLELDEAFTTDFTEWTDGRFVNNFRYLGDGLAVANVLHDEELEFDFDGEYDPAVREALWMSGDHFRVWLFDLTREQAWPVEGIDVDVGSGVQFARLDGRTFLFVPYDDWGRTKVYELDSDGIAVERFDTVGDVFKWVRVR